MRGGQVAWHARRCPTTACPTPLPCSAAANHSLPHTPTLYSCCVPQPAAAEHAQPPGSEALLPTLYLAGVQEELLDVESTHTHTPTLPHTHTLSPSHTLAHSTSNTVSHSPSNIFTHSHCHTLIHTHTHSVANQHGSREKVRCAMET